MQTNVIFRTPGTPQGEAMAVVAVETPWVLLNTSSIVEIMSVLEDTVGQILVTLSRSCDATLSDAPDGLLGVPGTTITLHDSDEHELVEIDALTVEDFGRN